MSNELTKSAFITSLDWINLGVSVCPNQAGNAKHLDVIAISDYGYTLNKLKSEIPKAGVLASWFSSGSKRGYSILTNDTYVALDFDSHEGYKTFTDRYSELANTYTVKTRNGYHLYYRTEIPLSGDYNKRVGDSLEFFCNGAHITSFGNGYEIIGDMLPRDCIQIPNDVYFIQQKTNNIEKRATNMLNNKINSKNTGSGSVISRIKNSIGITQYLSYMGVETKRLNSGWHMSLCPLHDDSVPSFNINPENTHCQCFTTGCAGHLDNTSKLMDIINLYQLHNNASTSRAIYELAMLCGF